MMIDDYTSPRDLSYGFTPEQLEIDPNTIREGPYLEWPAFFGALISPSYSKHDADSANRTLNMALALYERMMTTEQGNAFDGLDRNSVFAACLDTAFIWENG